MIYFIATFNRNCFISSRLMLECVDSIKLKFFSNLKKTFLFIKVQCTFKSEIIQNRDLWITQWRVDELKSNWFIINFKSFLMNCFDRLFINSFNEWFLYSIWIVRSKWIRQKIMIVWMCCCHVLNESTLTRYSSKFAKILKY